VEAGKPRRIVLDVELLGCTLCVASLMPAATARFFNRAESSLNTAVREVR
jgi:hypothetical protein